MCRNVLFWSGLKDSRIGYRRAKLSFNREESGMSSQIMRTRKRRKAEDMSSRLKFNLNDQEQLYARTLSYIAYMTTAFGTTRIK